MESPTWTPTYSKWRHGGWYVDNVQYPGGGTGCVSNNYPDKQWRIVCERSQTPFPSRDAAARAERVLALSQGSFTLVVDTTGAAFGDADEDGKRACYDHGPDAAHELARILRTIADSIRVDNGMAPSGDVKVLDLNGNTVGRWSW